MIKKKSKVKKKNRREEIFCFSTKKNPPHFSAHNLYYLFDSLVHT